MIKASKKVVYLERINSTANLIKGKDIYYIYYKSDGDLYMYDSLRSKEFNLFRLRVPVNGLLNICVEEIKKGTLIVTTNKPNRGLLEVIVEKIQKGVLNIFTKREPKVVSNGNLVIKTLREPIVAGDKGDVTIRVLTPSLSSEPSNGTIQVITNRVAKGVVTDSGNAKVRVIESTPTLNGNINIITNKNYSKGNIRVTVKQL